MAMWVRGSREGRWHAGRPSRPGSLVTHCGVTLGTDALSRSRGDTPKPRERCVECDASVIMDQRHTRLSEFGRARHLKPAFRPYRGW